MASVFKRGTRWYAKFKDATGGWCTRPTTAETKIDAKRLATARRAGKVRDNPILDVRRRRLPKRPPDYLRAHEVPLVLQACSGSKSRPTTRPPHPAPRKKRSVWCNGGTGPG